METCAESTTLDTAFAAELFAALPVDTQEAIIALIKSLLSER